MIIVVLTNREQLYVGVWLCFFPELEVGLSLVSMDNEKWKVAVTERTMRQEVAFKQILTYMYIHRQHACLGCKLRSTHIYRIAGNLAGN